MNTIHSNPPDAASTALTRRQFIKHTSLAGAGVLGSLALPRAVHAQSSQPLKLAVIGCGGRGTGAAQEALRNNATPVKLVAMADAFPHNLNRGLENLKREFGDKVEVPPDRQFTGLDGYKQAIAAADVVILATPPGFRPMDFEEAIRQKKHVFMEKPVATDVPGVRRVLAAAEEAKKQNLKVVVGFQRRFDPGYIETVKRIRDGDIGDVLAAHVYWNSGVLWVRKREELERILGRPPTEMEYQVHNWYYFNWLCGDNIVEQHVHNVDVINWIKNDYPVRAQGMGGCQVRTAPEYGENFDHHAVEYEYADGTRMYSYARHMAGCWNQVGENVIGTKGRSQPNRQTILGETRWRYRAEDTPRSSTQIEHDVLFDAIINDKPIEHSTAENGARSTMTAIMGRMACYSGQMMELETAMTSEQDLFPERLAWDAPPKVLPDEKGYYPRAMPGQTQVL
jgi:myo-inositol 2-dehydrogenase / D-chiro-inositol 1-dehydrogenase